MWPQSKYPNKNHMHVYDFTQDMYNWTVKCQSLDSICKESEIMLPQKFTLGHTQKHGNTLICSYTCVVRHVITGNINRLLHCPHCPTLSHCSFNATYCMSIFLHIQYRSDYFLAVLTTKKRHGIWPFEFCRYNSNTSHENCVDILHPEWCFPPFLGWDRYISYG